MRLEKKVYGSRLPAELKEIEGYWWVRTEWPPDSTDIFWYDGVTKFSREEIESAIEDDPNAYITPDGSLVARMSVPPERLESLRSNPGFKIGINLVNS